LSKNQKEKDIDIGLAIDEGPEDTNINTERICYQRLTQVTMNPEKSTICHLPFLLPSTPILPPSPSFLLPFFYFPFLL
jgi:hypothetical protein